MSYCTLTDITENIPTTMLAQLSNDTTPATVSEDIVNQFITDSSAIIDSYLRGRYTLPLNNTHTILKKICIDIIKYELYKRRNIVNESVNIIYKDAIATLDKLQKGIVVLNESTTTDKPSFYLGTTHTNIFSDDLLSNYLL